MKHAALVLIPILALATRAPAAEESRPRRLELRLAPRTATLTVTAAVRPKAARQAARAADAPADGALDSAERQAAAQALGRDAWAGLSLAVNGETVPLRFGGATATPALDAVTAVLVAELPAPPPQGLTLELRDTAARRRASELRVVTEGLVLEGATRTGIRGDAPWRGRVTAEASADSAR